MQRILSQKITPFLWFDKEAEAAAEFYTSVFNNSEIRSVAYYSNGAPAPEGSVMTVDFTIEGQNFVALNGGPQFKFSPAVSFVVNCKDQEEIDYFWDNLSKGGSTEQCGWLRDKFGLSWQVVPENLGEILKGKNGEKAMQALLGMKKIIIADLTEIK